MKVGQLKVGIKNGEKLPTPQPEASSGSSTPDELEQPRQSTPLIPVKTYPQPIVESIQPAQPQPETVVEPV
jgi:hypothetical protein